MKKITLLFVVVSLNLYSQVGGESIYNFLNITGSARQAAWGGKVITLMDEVNQPLWNPSTINQNLDNQFGLNFNKFSFNYAFTKYHPASNSSTFSLQIDLN